MKKLITYAFILTLIISSCGTHAAQGAYTGSQIGSVLGSAIGGLSNGWRGRDVGTIAGMVGGAVVGGAIGNACDKAKEKKVETTRSEDYDDYDGTYSRNSSRERHYSESKMRYMHTAELRNIIFYDKNDNGILSGEENAELVFEIYNSSNNTIYDVVPVVEETSGKKHIAISKTQEIEKIEPGKAIRYTAYIKAGKKIKNGTAAFRISIYSEDDKLLAPRTEFEIETKR